MRALLSALVFSLPLPVLAVQVDGRIDPTEWADAQRIDDFRLTQPLTRAPSPHATEAWYKATEYGLAIAFRNRQPARVPRTRQRFQRDRNGNVDRVNVYVDFDGDGRSGYNFMVGLSNDIADSTISNENQFNGDWDGHWTHAVSEDDDGWSAEMLIPWHIAPMRQGDGATRTIGLALDRVVGDSNERMAWPAISFNEQRYLSELRKVEVPQYSQSLLAITPYVVGLYDNVGGKADFDAGADIFWKPNGQFQLSGTINPDFGQVESDGIVVNFSAIETFFGDKRPFFTENQGYFEVPFGSLGNAQQLIYTRRIGAPADDGSGAGDVAAAVKINGSAGGFGYGVFAATENDDAGRDFYALRATRDFAGQGVGAMLTRVNRPFLDREATVFSLDHRWSPNARWTVRSNVVGSSVVQNGDRLRDTGGQMRIDHQINDAWRQQLYLLHTGGDLQLNDFGFLDRNNFNYGRYEVSRRITGLPEDSPYASHQWRYAVSRRTNDDGVHIADAFAINRGSERRDGGNQFVEIAGWTSGHEDLITRGHGAVKHPGRLFGFAERFFPKKTHWSFYANLRYSAEGLGGIDRGAWSVTLEPAYAVNDDLSFSAGLELQRNPDWLLWRGDNLLGTFGSEQAFLSLGSVWLIDPKQELRVRLEALGLDAEAKRAWRVAADGTPVRSNDALDDFALRNLGFQVRYRYEFAPLSYLYVAYVRGGSLFQRGVGPYSVGDEFTGAFDLRDSEQLLVKLSYRFEI
ncbi:DUF5916 domain-containing protein [Lysobacter brunescens]|uniref:DUF5916 domain-containing protein n=1 Tax=Lysobacter brunescens TaxID=262323 RepID=A0ABW2YDX9_9GAMM